MTLDATITFTCTANPDVEDMVKRMSVALVRVAERISDTYRVVVDALTDSIADNPLSLVGQAATIGLVVGGTRTRSFGGIISEATAMGQAGERQWYRFVMEPPLAGMRMTRRSRCFLTVGSAAARTPEDVLTKTLAKAVGVPVTACSFQLEAGYPVLPSALQVDETDLDFMKRTAEAAGIGWYFNREKNGAAVCFADSFVNYPWVTGDKGTSALGRGQIIGATLSQKWTTQQTVLHAWNPEKPSDVLTASAPTAPDASKSTVELYEQAYTDATVGEKLATVRQAEVTTGGMTLRGTAIVPAMSPGYAFTFSKPGFGQPFADTYLLTQVDHVAWHSAPGSEAIREMYLREAAIAGLTLPQEGSGYGNAYVAVAKSTDFRPARVTPKPRIAGVLRATLCDNNGATAAAAGAVAAPYMDAQGRYQVVLPYPAADGKAGCLFAPLRIMSSFGGSLEVQQMPLRIGTTVYLMFEGGDVDRPLIAGVLPNADQPTAIPNTVQPAGSASTYLQSVLKTSSGIVVKITDGTPLVVAKT